MRNEKRAVAQRLIQFAHSIKLTPTNLVQLGLTEGNTAVDSKKLSDPSVLNNVALLNHFPATAALWLLYT